jgi:hypothetical protein
VLWTSEDFDASWDGRWRRRGACVFPGAERKLTGKKEALLVATACSNPPGRPCALDEPARERNGEADRA